MITTPDEYSYAKAQAVSVLSEMMDRKLGILVAARRLSALRHYLVGDQLDDDWCVFIGIDSESDHLPIGSERAHWQPEALLEKDAEIAAAELFYEKHAFSAARNLIRKYKNEA